MLLFTEIFVGYVCLAVVTMLILVISGIADKWSEDKFLIHMVAWPVFWVKTVVRFFIWLVSGTIKYVKE